MTGSVDAARTRGTLSVLAASVCFSTISIFVITATRAGAPLLTVLAGRYLFAALVLIALNARAAFVADGRTSLLILFVAGGLQASVTYVTLAALDYIPAATMVFLFYTYPGWLALFAAVRRIEPIDRVRGTALALSLGGVALIVGSPGSARLHPAGIGLSLLGALLYAIYIPFISRLQQRVPSRTITILVALGVTTIVAPIALVTGTLTIHLAPIAWFGIAGLALVSTVLAFLFLFRGLALLGPVRTAIIATVEPFWTAILGALILSQPLSAGVLLGGSLIAAAVLLLQRSTAR
jgi:drug/metabolite transporter (DMT)-like permease